MSTRNFFAFLAILPLTASAQTPKDETKPKPEPDVLIFTDGEKLIGHLERSTGDKVTFKSDMAGEVTVDWKKIQELHTSLKFAVVRKNVELHRRDTGGSVPKGTLTVKDQKIEVNAGSGQTPQSVPVADAAFVVDQASFEKAFHRPGLLEDWKGSVTAGASLVEATQDSVTLTGGFSLIRAVPQETWLDPRNRTIVSALHTGKSRNLTRPPSRPPSTTPMRSATNTSRRDCMALVNWPTTTISPRAWSCSNLTGAASVGLCSRMRSSRSI